MTKESVLVGLLSVILATVVFTIAVYAFNFVTSLHMCAKCYEDGLWR